MPYLPVDIDGKRRAEMIADSLGIPRAVTVYGLVQLWEYVWREKRDVVTPLYLGACFGPDERLHAALVEAGFLEQTDEGWRVRGAKRWLFGMEGRARGGQAAKKHLIPGAAHKKASQPNPAEGPKEASSAPAEGEPKGSPTLSPSPHSAPPSALTPSTQHPAPSLKEEEAAAPPKERPRPKLPDSAGCRFYAWFQNKRAQAGLPPEPDQKQPHAREIDATYSALLMHSGGDEEAAKEAVYRYGDDPYWQKKNLPWAGFARNWGSYAPPRRNNQPAA